MGLWREAVERDKDFVETKWVKKVESLREAFQRDKESISEETSNTNVRLDSRPRQFPRYTEEHSEINNEGSSKNFILHQHQKKLKTNNICHLQSLTYLTSLSQETR